MRNKGVLAVLAAVFLFGSLSPLAAAPVIERGIDVFTTIPEGGSYYDFSVNPIPAGFFCKTSRPFTGRVALTGLPLETEIPGQLRGADTVVERLDDAVFDASGTAVTRIQVRALSLVSVAPIKTSCGAYHVYITLAGQQRATTMRIFRTHENGGTFAAPLAVDARMTFVPVKARKPRKLELGGSFTFPPRSTPWSFERTGPVAKRTIGEVNVDTNGDLIPDTLLRGTSNFAPGWSPTGFVAKPIWGGENCTLCEPEMCHENDGCEHCTGGVYACNGRLCP